MSVYANGREVSGKAQPKKVVAGFPSVCLSPPSPPAGPIPIPYPMFRDASKTSDGTGSVKIRKKEVGKKNGSVCSSSKGNEPATRSFGMDVVSHAISGASKHRAYSFGVLFEKAGAERFPDLTTTNHGSDPATAVRIDGAGVSAGTVGADAECEAMQEQNRKDFEAAQSASESQTQRRHDRARSDDQPGITIAQASVNGAGGFSGTSSASVRELVPKFKQPPNQQLRGVDDKNSQRTVVDGKQRYAMDIRPRTGAPTTITPRAWNMPRSIT